MMIRVRPFCFHVSRGRVQRRGVGVAAVLGLCLALTGSTALAEDDGSRLTRKRDHALERGWVEVGRETFDEPAFAAPPTWRRQTPDDLRANVPEDAMPFADDGEFFERQNPAFVLPEAFRLTAAFGRDAFLTIESYSRRDKPLSELASIVDDPAEPGNRALHIASPEHTDATLIRTTQPLGRRYEISARVGFIAFGTGDGANGYSGGERSAPWVQGSAVGENGCYFGAIYRAVPKPSNSFLAHQLRIGFLDTDNNLEGWTHIWAPKMGRFLASGWHPVVMAVVDGSNPPSGEPNGPPLVTHAAGVWGAPGQVQAVDAYKERTWYTVTIRRFDDQLTLRIEGDFRYGGQTAYEATVEDASGLFGFGEPHYWCLGDPHINFYEGSMLVDDIILKEWRD